MMIDVCILHLVKWKTIQTLRSFLPTLGFLGVCNKYGGCMHHMGFKDFFFSILILHARDIIGVKCPAFGEQFHLHILDQMYIFKSE